MSISVKNDEYQALANAIGILYKPVYYKQLNEAERDTLQQALSTMSTLHDKQVLANIKTAENIRRHRKEDPLYGRSEEYKAYRRAKLCQQQQ